MLVKLKRLNSQAQLPKQSKEGDFCYDVWATSEEEIAPGVWKYGLGFKYEIARLSHSLPPNWRVCIDLRPRSGIYKTGMVLANSEGTLDEFFRGEACAIFYWLKPEVGDRYHVGDRVGQIKIGVTPPVRFEFDDEINEETERGEGGFGSTGLK